MLRRGCCIWRVEVGKLVGRDQPYVGGQEGAKRDDCLLSKVTGQQSRDFACTGCRASC